MRPDRIVVGEVRGEEAFDMLQAMNTGHEGLAHPLSHANSAAMPWPAWRTWFPWRTSTFPDAPVRHQIASAIHAVVQIARLSDGTRKVIAISEITG